MSDDDSFADPIDHLPQIKVHITNGDTYYRIVASDNFTDIESICRLIESSTFAIKYEDQIIVHQGKLLRERNTNLDDLGIINREMRVTVYTKLEPRIIPVVLKTEVENLDLEIDSQATVGEFMRLIDKITGIPPNRQLLKVLNVTMNEDMNEDYVLIKEYVTRVPFKVKLREIPRDEDYMIEINVMNPENEFAILEVDMFDTVYALHGEVRKEELAEGHMDFYLEWKGQRLDGNRSLSYYNIKEDDFIYVKYLDW